MSKLEILYIGQVIDIADVHNYSGVSTAGALFEWNVVSGLAKDTDIDIYTISVPPVTFWPKDHKLFYHKQEKKLSVKIRNSTPLFLNLPYIKQLFQIFSVYAIGKKCLAQHPNAIVLSYNTYPQIGLPAAWLVKKFKSRHICLLADLPFDDRKNQNLLRRFIWNIYGGTAWKLMKKCKEYIILNENAKTYIPENSRYLVMEGGIQPKDYHFKRDCITDETGHRILLYSGALTEYSGIIQLVNAMSSLTDLNLVLHIYGNGDLKETILTLSAQTTNIVYKGLVPIDEIRKRQANAWLLVNPRSVEDPISKVTFPSKLLEYMASGTPVLSTRTNGLRAEYLDKLFLCDNENHELLSKTIREIYVNTDMKKRGNCAKLFVTAEKSWDKQIVDVVNFFRRDSNE